MEKDTLKTEWRITFIRRNEVLHGVKATEFELGILINFPNDSTGFEIERIPNFIEK